MAYPEEAALQAETAREKPRPAWFRLRHVPTIAGAALPSAAILWAHAENYLDNAAVYAVQPPTVSRALTNPDVAGPFAIAMILGAVLLSIAVCQIAAAMWRLLRDLRADGLSWLLLAIAAISEIPAIAGMVVLSQFTGDAFALQHNIGSYMLFFGHAIAIGVSGILLKRLAAGAPANPRLAPLHGLPRHAAWCTLFSLLFGINYFGMRAMPDFQPFWSHLALAAVEMVVLISFLAFLGRFWRLIHAERR